MGNCSPVPVEDSDPEVPIFALIFRSGNEIRLVMASMAVCDIVRGTCIKVAKDELEIDGVSEKGWYAFRFKGDPFSARNSASSALIGRQLASQILLDLYQNGWRFLLSTRISRQYNNTNWYFKQISIERPLTSLICIAISSRNGLKVIGCNDELFQLVVQTCKECYTKGVTDSVMHSHGDHEIKLCGSPWFTSDALENIAARRLILALVEQLHRHRYRLYATADVKDTADSMFFAFDPDSPLVDEQFFCMSLDSQSIVRLINCDEDVVNAIAEAACKHWSKGLDEAAEIGPKDGCRIWEIRLNGHPWFSADNEAVEARALVCSIFEMLLSRGWCLLTSLDISRKDHDKGVFIFRSCLPAIAPCACLGFFDTSNLTVIRGSKLLSEIVRETCFAKYKPGVMEAGDYQNTHSLMFRGTPFAGRYNANSKAMHMTMLNCHWLHEFSKSGWTVISSADVSSRFCCIDGEKMKCDVHGWFLVFTGRKDNGVAP